MEAKQITRGRQAPRSTAIGLARVRELAAANMPITVAPKQSLAEVLTDAARREGFTPPLTHDPMLDTLWETYAPPF